MNQEKIELARGEVRMLRTGIENAITRDDAGLAALADLRHHLDLLDSLLTK